MFSTSMDFGCLPYLRIGSPGSSPDSIVPVSLPSSSEISNDCFRVLFSGDDRSEVTSSESVILRFLLFESYSSKILMVSFVGVLRPLRFGVEAVISLNACLEAPILPPLSRDDLGVKNRVKDLGVIVGALRGLLPGFVDVAQLDRGYSWDPGGV